MRINEDLRPLSEIKTRPGDIVNQVNETGRPVVLTHYGKGVAVVLSVEEYERVQKDAATLRLVSALKVGERAIEAGQVVDHAEVDQLLKGWAGDGA